MFNKILIANRGEIACRIMRSAQSLGIECVAVYSSADRDAPFVRMADEAYYIGEASPTESYLRSERILTIAKQCAAQAIHPGYGFLAENAEFAKQCEQQGIVFIGPPAAAIEAMGSKSAAKSLMQQAKVPLVPGYHGDQQDNQTLTAEALKIGFPLLIKASLGGGGKGMRVVNSAEELNAAFDAARREALNAFGDERLLLERYLTQPRHVEIQIFCDQQGNGVYLFERDCSIQRRHQKVIEEAPAPNFPKNIRVAMGEAALACAKTINYVGAGTVEFLLDSDGQFYFMEMNTRLQVEHPVTEFITQQDLVQWQLKVAAGLPLPCSQEDLHIHGHAFEARIYAEDPDHEFLPSTGQLLRLRTPIENDFVRVDSGLAEGGEVSIHYDPMIAKLIVWGPDRLTAAKRMLRALSQYQVVGVQTNIEFLQLLFAHPAFLNEEFATNFIEQHQTSLLPTQQGINEKSLLLATVAYLAKLRQPSSNPWEMADSWQTNQANTQLVQLQTNEEIQRIKVTQQGMSFTLESSQGKQQVTALWNGEHLRLDDGKQQFGADIFYHQYDIYVLKSGTCTRFSLPIANFESSAQQQGAMIAPMNGRVIALNVKAGDSVQKGELLAVIEAMKMEHPILAPKDGVIGECFCAEQELVQAQQQLLAFAE